VTEDAPKPQEPSPGPTPIFGPGRSTYSRKENPFTQGMKLGTTGCVGCVTFVVLIIFVLIVLVAIVMHH
jgi:hypothetical protein